MSNSLGSCQALPSMGFSRQESWNGLPFPSPGDLPNPRDWTFISYIGRWILYHCVTRKLPVTHVNVKISFFQRSISLLLGTAIPGGDTEVQLVHMTDAHRWPCSSYLVPKVARLPQGLPRWTRLPVHAQERPQSTLTLDSFPGSPQNHSDLWKCFLLLQCLS